MTPNNRNGKVIKTVLGIALTIVIAGIGYFYEEFRFEGATRVPTSGREHYGKQLRISAHEP
jgi:hypothetical protein